MSRFQILDSNLVEQIESLPPNEQDSWLFLLPHPEFAGAWYVDSLDQSFFFDFEDLIGQYRVLFPHQLAEFRERCKELDYTFAFTEDPEGTLSAYDGLNDPPPFAIESTLENTVNGFLHWQIQGFNKLIKPTELRGGLCLWDTGTGKTVFVAMGILWHLIHRNEADLVFVVVRSNNKRDMQKKLKRLADIDSVVLDGERKKRYQLFVDIDAGRQPKVVITNYEKFREDEEFFQEIMTDRRILIFWDEMPMKLSNRGTQLYNAVRDSLYTPYKKGAVFWNRKRPEWLRQYELTATPINTDPGNQFSCVRIIDPDALGSVGEFENEFVASRNPMSHKPQMWHKVDKIGHKLNFMMHRVDKTQPEVAKYFPKLIEDTVTIDWKSEHRKIYDTLSSKALMMLDEGEDINILSMMMVMRMLCNAPSMVAKSAANREMFEALLTEAIENDDPGLISGITMGSAAALQLVEAIKGPLVDDGHTKIERLREDLLERYPDSKVLCFSSLSNYLFPVLEENLSKWGVSYVTYSGTDKQRQSAKDYWRTTPDCRVLVSSDAGSDSLDLPEANLVINYELPTLHSRKYQRIHRASRADSGHDWLYVLNYVMADSIEERFEALIRERYAYHADLVGAAASVTASATLGRDDFYYLLTGSYEAT